MSYDLFFRSRLPDPTFSLQDFVDYFKARPRYEIKPSQAWYSNPDSGVYFAFEYSERIDDPDPKNEFDHRWFPVTFNLNYFRPHPFGLEAEPEVAAFVHEFDLTVIDAQISGMGEGEFSMAGFLRGWNAGNETACRAIRSQSPTQKFPSLPSSQIEAAWRWNFACKKRQSEIGSSVFSPRIFFFDQSGELRTGVVWTDGIPILLPVVDIVLVPRRRLAPRRFFRTQNDVLSFDWAELEPVPLRFPKSSGALDAYELFYKTTPPDIVQMIRDHKPPANPPKGIAFDQVLDRELLEQAAC